MTVTPNTAALINNLDYRVKQFLGNIHKEGNTRGT
jgi:hypothetical protein